MGIVEIGDHSVLINGINFHYTVRGEGPYLLAHSGGPGMDARGWGDFAGLDEHFTIVQFHPRGSGLSGSPGDGSYFLSDYANDLEAFRQYLGLQKPALIGWSHGGMVAQEYAFSYPGSISKLILYDTAAYFGEFLEDVEAAVEEFKDEPWYQDSLDALQKEWAGEYQTAAEMAALWAKEMKFYFKEFNELAKSYQRETEGLPIQIDPLKFFNDHEAEDMDLRPRLAEVEVPVLIIVGRHDFITNVAMAEEMAVHLPDARLEIFENSGHFAHVEEPAKFREVVRNFLLSS